MQSCPLFSLLTWANAELRPEGEPFCETMEIFPRVSQHTHASTIVELPDGSLLAAWFQGSGERSSDDVAIMGARLQPGAVRWSVPFVMADVPGFPDVNPVLFLDSQRRLWLVWYTVIAHQWETSLLKYRISEDYRQAEGPPRWNWQDVIHVKPGSPAEHGIQPDDRFVRSVERQIEAYARYLEERLAAGEEGVPQDAVEQWRRWGERILAKASGQDMVRRGYVRDDSGHIQERMLGYPYFRRMGWQTKNKPVLLDGGRIVLPLYSDGFDFSLMAITDDGGRTWRFSEPLVGPGNIQPSIAIKRDGTLVAYMRDNGPPPKRLHVSESSDGGYTWSGVRDSTLPNPGSGADVVTLQNGHWVLLFNDTESGRHRLAAALSTDEGRTWRIRYLERDLRDPEHATQSSYPSVIQGRDGTIHVVYSSHRRDQPGMPHATIKYARFNERWLQS